MVRAKRFFIPAVVALSLAVVAIYQLSCNRTSMAGQQFTVGDFVYAKPLNSAWLHGRIDASCADGWHVAFDDGKSQCLLAEQIVRDVVPAPDQVHIGAQVIARTSRGQMLLGRVIGLEGQTVNIRFKRLGMQKLPLRNIRLR